MTCTRSRWLPLVAVLVLFAGAGCSNEAPTRSSGGGDPAAVGATGTAAPGTETTTEPSRASGSASSSPASAASASGGASTPGTAGSRGPTTTGPGRPATTTTTGSGPSNTTTTAPVGGCPDPRGCPNYKLLGGRWPRDANGIATVHYRIKTSGHTPVHTAPITPEQLVTAVRAAAQTWMDAVPSVRLVYDGIATQEPSGGNNVVGWGPLTPEAVANTDFSTSDAGKTYTGFHITLSNTYGFTWRPCDAAQGQPCDDDNNLSVDLHGILTHEWGHALGLDHPNNQPGTGELTMYGGGGNRRHNVTLGLGDILGVRNLYPTNAPMPTLYRP